MHLSPSNPPHLILFSPLLSTPPTHPSMEPQQVPPPPSPNTPSSSNSSSSSSSNNNLTIPPPPSAVTLPPLTPKSTPRTDANPYPTTFIQADATSFKQVVQMLTGTTETAAKASSMPPKSPAPPAARPPGPKKPSFKLYERRGSFRHLKTINPFLASHPPSPPPRNRQPEILSPSMLDLPSLVLSPVTPLISDPFHRCSSASEEEEERVVIAEKGFYLHPSPRSAADPPPLLPLFPVTSPRVSSAAP